MCSKRSLKARSCCTRSSSAIIGLESGDRPPRPPVGDRRAASRPARPPACHKCFHRRALHGKGQTRSGSRGDCKPRVSTCAPLAGAWPGSSTIHSPLPRARPPPADARPPWTVATGLQPPRVVGADGGATRRMPFAWLAGGVRLAAANLPAANLSGVNLPAGVRPLFDEPGGEVGKLLQGSIVEVGVERDEREAHRKIITGPRRRCRARRPAYVRPGPVRGPPCCRRLAP